MAKYFRELIHNHTIKKIVIMKFTMVHNPQWAWVHEAQSRKVFITKINIQVIFKVFTKFLDHEKLELYSMGGSFLCPMLAYTLNNLPNYVFRKLQAVMRRI